MGVLTRRAAAKARRRPSQDVDAAVKSSAVDKVDATPSPAGTDDDEGSAHSSASSSGGRGGGSASYDSDGSRSSSSSRLQGCLDSPTEARHRQPRPKSQSSSAAAAAQSARSALLLPFFALGICSSYCTYGIIQERLFSRGTDQGDAVKAVGPITTFLILSQALTNAAVARMWVWIQRNLLRRGGERGGCASSASSRKNDDDDAADDEGGRGLNHPLLVLTSLCYFGAMTASNEALNHVSYPTVVLAKSSKLIPTMMAGVLLERRIYSVGEWLGALLITGGIVLFNWSRMAQAQGKAASSGGDSPYGLVLLLISLTMDGTLASCQGALKRNDGAQATGGINMFLFRAQRRRRRDVDGGIGTTNQALASRRAQRRDERFRPPTAIELMLYTNLYSALFLLPTSYYSGQLHNGLSLLLTQTCTTTSAGLAGASSARKWISMLNLTAATGQIFIFLTIHTFGSLTCTTITTTRKFFTILLSVRSFGHAFGMVQWTAVGMVFGGLAAEIGIKLGGTAAGGGGDEVGSVHVGSVTPEGVAKKND